MQASSFRANFGQGILGLRHETQRRNVKAIEKSIADLVQSSFSGRRGGINILFLCCYAVDLLSVLSVGLFAKRGQKKETGYFSVV